MYLHFTLSTPSCKTNLFLLTIHLRYNKHFVLVLSCRVDYSPRDVTRKLKKILNEGPRIVMRHANFDNDLRDLFDTIKCLPIKISYVSCFDFFNFGRDSCLFNLYGANVEYLLCVKKYLDVFSLLFLS